MKKNGENIYDAPTPLKWSTVSDRPKFLGDILSTEGDQWSDVEKIKAENL
jgi:hypothetical protein